jgi:hypothetical protein
MKLTAALGLALLALACLSACAPGAGSLLLCMAVDHDINRRCQ